MNRLKRAGAFLAMVTALLCALAPRLARAETDAEKKQKAKEHYEIATRFYDVGKYDDAIREYEQAYLLTGDAALLFNIGQAYRLWDHSEDAIRVYKNYLRQRPDAVNRADVERKIAELERQVEERRRLGGAPLAEPVPAPPSVAGPPPPMPPPVQPAPEAAPSPVEAPAPPAGVLAGTSPAEPGTPAAGHSVLTYSLLGISGAFLATAVVAGAVGASKAKKLQDASRNNEPFDPAVQENGKTANQVAVTAAVLGLVAGGFGGYFFWRERKAARASVALAPLLSPTFAGGSALLTF